MKRKQKKELLKQTISLALTVLSGRLYFWKSFQITAEKRYSWESLLILLQVDYSQVKTYIIETTKKANTFQSNKTYMLNFKQLQSFKLAHKY